MPRHNRRDPRPRRATSPGPLHRVETGPAGFEVDHHVHAIAASTANKTYLCPGCNQTIVPGTAHVVAWPVEHGGGEDRRHWHTGCWRGRSGRTGYRS